MDSPQKTNVEAVEEAKAVEAVEEAKAVECPQDEDYTKALDSAKTDDEYNAIINRMMKERAKQSFQRDMDIEMSTGAFVYYFEKLGEKPLVMDDLLRDVGIKSKLYKVMDRGSDRKSIWFVMLCVYGRYDFDDKKQIRIAFEGTKRVVEAMNIPIDEMYEHFTMRGVLEGYPKMIEEMPR